MPLPKLEDIFELGTTAENYGEYYGTTRKSVETRTIGLAADLDKFETRRL
jgi:hypothetical protein